MESYNVFNSTINFESTANYIQNIGTKDFVTECQQGSQLNFNSLNNVSQLKDDSIKFDLSAYQSMESDSDDEFYDVFDSSDSDEIDLNKTYTTKTMSKKQIALITTALEETELQDE